MGSCALALDRRPLSRRSSAFGSWPMSTNMPSRDAPSPSECCRHTHTGSQTALVRELATVHQPINHGTQTTAQPSQYHADKHNRRSRYRQPDNGADASANRDPCRLFRIHVALPCTPPRYQHKEITSTSIVETHFRASTKLARQCWGAAAMHTPFPSWVMYGRRPRCKRNLTFLRSVRVRSCIRPVVAWRITSVAMQPLWPLALM